MFRLSVLASCGRENLRLTSTLGEGTRKVVKKNETMRGGVSGCVKQDATTIINLTSDPLLSAFFIIIRTPIVVHLFPCENFRDTLAEGRLSPYKRRAGELETPSFKRSL